MKKLLLILLILGVIPLAGCYEIVYRIAVRSDLKVVMTSDVRLDPSFFQTAYSRKGNTVKDPEAFRQKLIDDFKDRMKLFDTLQLVEESLINVTKQDSCTLVHSELILPSLKCLHTVNRLFWSGLVDKPRSNLPAFTGDINISMKGDSLPVLEIAPVSAKYQSVYGIESIDIENVDLYSDLFNDKLCTFSFTADKFIKFQGTSVIEIENGAQWEYPALDLLLHGRTSFKPVTLFITYPYGTMVVTKENQPSPTEQPIVGE
ncbi:MAG TPA: hypothetical protein VIX80_10525 [Candidatus Kapabacteria bacterium]